MAVLEEWIVAEPIDEKLVARIELVLSKILPKEVERTISIAENSLFIDVSVLEDDLLDLATQLDSPLYHFIGSWDWKKEIDELEEGDTYVLRVEVMRKHPETLGGDGDDSFYSVLSVYSKDADNNAGWPAAFVLASRIAYELGASDDLP